MAWYIPDILSQNSWYFQDCSAWFTDLLKLEAKEWPSDFFLATTEPGLNSNWKCVVCCKKSCEKEHLQHQCSSWYPACSHTWKSLPKGDVRLNEGTHHQTLKWFPVHWNKILFQYSISNFVCHCDAILWKWGITCPLSVSVLYYECFVSNVKLISFLQ